MADSTLFDFCAREYSRSMRWFARAGLMVCLAALPLTQACATLPGSSSAPAGYSATPSGGAPISSAAANSPDTAITAPAPTFDPSGYKVDSAKSKALSDYLTRHKLPLVGAQVMRGPDAQRGVVLYGFVGSDFGKQDAVAKSREFLNDPSLAVNNRIKVNPELLTSSQPADSSAEGAAGAAATTDSSSSYPGANAYTQNQQSEAQQYVQNQNRNAQLSAMAPALMIGMMALSFASGGMISAGPGPGSFGSPGFSTFGGPIGSPFGPPTGYPSPYSPFGP